LNITPLYLGGPFFCGHSVYKECFGEFNGRKLYTGLRLAYRLRLWAPASTSRAISAVAELLVIFC